MPHHLTSLFFLALALTQADAGHANPGRPDVLRITVLFNNVEHQSGLEAGWGFSCLIQGLAGTILFDTGGDGGVLLSNMHRLGLEPHAVDTIVLSHIHGDHTGGLDAFLAKHGAVEVIMPEAFPASFRQAVADRGARVGTVRQGGRLMDDVYTTGELGALHEQSLLLDTAKGLVIITGCAHPGIDRIAQEAVRLTGRPIHLLMGGFHLLGADRPEIQAIIARLQALGVEQVAPSHCTGDAAIALFRQAWGGNFVEGGLGAVIRVLLR
ncbi:MAG: MBL fold metallo-hydrolase [Pseudomonadota bacterium]